MGLNGSGPASRVLMDLWVDKLKETEDKTKIMARGKKATEEVST